jgi:hypothetical protein
VVQLENRKQKIEISARMKDTHEFPARGQTACGGMMEAIRSDWLVVGRD